MASASLSIPIAFWSQSTPTATISATLACEGYVVAGLEEGLIWVFKATCGPTDAGPPEDIVSLEPCTLLVGHSSRITALQSMLVEGDTKSTCEWILISASEDGEVKKWNLVDGRCLQSNPFAFIGVPTYLGVISTVEKNVSGPKFILCAGLSNEACILDSTSLEVVRVWGGHQDWVYCTALPGDDHHQSRILSVSADCKLSLWIFDTASLAVVKSKVFEICSKTNDSIVSLVACRQDSSWAALVTRSSVQRACYVVRCPEGEALAGAEFVCSKDIIIWTQSGHVYYYSLAELRQHNSHSKVDVLEHSAMEPRYEIPSGESSIGATATVSDWRPPSDYPPSVMVFSNAGSHYFLNLQNTLQGLHCSSANLLGYNTDQPQGKVTFSTMLNDTLVALGHDSGDIRVCPVDEALLDLASGFVNEHAKETTVLKGHIGPISSIFTTDDLMGRSFILSGGKDCSARIWNIEAGTEVACFNNHSRPVTHFLQVPDDVNSRVKRSVISIAEDHSIAIISIEEMSCIYLFGGYEHALVSIQWRPPEDYIVLWHADETAFVWQMQTGHLDRIVKGETARAIMADSRWKVCEISPRRPTSSKRAFDCMTVPLGVPGSKASVPVVVMNLKYVLGILTPARNTDQQSDQPGFKSSAVSPPEPQVSARHRRIFSGQSRASAKAKPGTVEEPAALSEMAQQCLRAAKVVLGLLITEDDAYAVSIRNLLNIPPPTKTIALGLRGAYGNISIRAPAFESGVSDSWCVSPTMTASKLIVILSLSKMIATAQNLDVDMDTWSRGYCNATQDSVGQSFCPPSLSFLAKYWQDPQVEIQEVTKIILLSAIGRMSKTDLTSLIKYWSAFLPAAALPDSCSSQYMARSAIILGIIGAENAEALPEKVRKIAALSLTILLNDDSRVSYKVASIDLLSQGFTSWQPFIRADAVLKTLFLMAMDTQAANSLVYRRARRAIAQIALVNPALFNPAVLYNGIPRLAEAIVKSLDPTVPNMRESLLPVGTSVLLDLVQSYPQLDVHVGSQKLAVGTAEGAIVVYDLQTATRWQILEGHTNTASAVAFSRDGKTIVSCSVKEGSVRFWQPNPGFFGMLMGGSSLWGPKSSSSGGGGGGTGHPGSIPSLSSQQSSRSFDFALQDSIVTGSEEQLLNHIRLEWTGDRVAKLSIYDHIMSFNV
ncbi:hypothetical protein EC957_008626 [Mortierella hygrophila]|uniref:WD40 repeat-like protein n=1 Tax=Mortierella hygrophila TaxID=979708 RepID=A0A9P6FB41_9FUNG|nr:hypothetical protein EC957_008626 [Mortierella hygrophila]